MRARLLALLVPLGIAVACASHRPEVEPHATKPAPSSHPPLAGADAGATQKVFTLGCQTDPSAPNLERIELARAPGERWLWACRALAMLGTPKLRESGYPDFQVKDGVTGVCMTLSVEDSGAFIYHAPEERGAALRAALEAQPNVPDCSFELGLNGAGARPMKVGVRAGQPFQEPLYDLDSFDGARAFFVAHPSEDSAGGVISRYLELPASSRPTDVTPVLEQALEIELDAFAKMETKWLSDVGKDGYCMRVKDLAKLPVGKERAQRVATEVKRFCRR